MLREQQNKYKARQKKSEDDIVNGFNKFAASLSGASVNTAPQNDAPEDGNWKNHVLKFAYDEKEIRTKDPSIVYANEAQNEEDSLVTIDPRENRKLTYEETHMNLHQRKLRATKNLDKW